MSQDYKAIRSLFWTMHGTKIEDYKKTLRPYLSEIASMVETIEKSSSGWDTAMVFLLKNSERTKFREIVNFCERGMDHEDIRLCYGDEIPFHLEIADDLAESALIEAQKSEKVKILLSSTRIYKSKRGIIFNYNQSYSRFEVFVKIALADKDPQNILAYKCYCYEALVLYLRCLRDFVNNVKP